MYTVSSKNLKHIPCSCGNSACEKLARMNRAAASRHYHFHLHFHAEKRERVFLFFPPPRKPDTDADTREKAKGIVCSERAYSHERNQENCRDTRRTSRNVIRYLSFPRRCREKGQSATESEIRASSCTHDKRF